MVLESLDREEFGRLVADPVYDEDANYENRRLQWAFAIIREWIEEALPESLNSFLYKLQNQALVIRLDVGDAKDAFKLSILIGTADTVAPPATNADVVAKLVPGAKEQRLPNVTHYDFLGECTQAGKRVVPQCGKAGHQEEAHEAAVADATRELQGAL